MSLLVGPTVTASGLQGEQTNKTTFSPEYKPVTISSPKCLYLVLGKSNNAPRKNVLKCPV